MTLSRTFALGLAAMTLTAGAAAANTVYIDDGYPATFSVECPDGCLGVVRDGPPHLDPDKADAFNLSNASEATIASTLSSLVMKTFETSVIQKYDVSGDGTDYAFDVTPGYFFTKYGQLTAFFFTDTAQNVTFLKNGKGPGELSNYGTAGVGVIPLPAAGWLMVAGLGGLAAARARRRSG